MRDDIDSATLARYLLGECDKQESEEIRRWIEADPARGEMVAALREVWRQGPERRPKLDVDAFWTRVEGRMESPSPREPMRLVPPDRPLFGRLSQAPRAWWPRVAGAVAAAAVLAVAFPWVRERIETAAGRTAKVATREVATKRGERAQVYLADGTRVILAAESRLRFPLDFGAGARDVELQGQAFFEVIHDERKVFRVRTPTSVVEDLGTEFVVQAYPDDTVVQVAVASGRVALVAAAAQDSTRATAPANPLILDAGAVGRLEPDGRAVRVPEASVEAYLAWTTGELRFQETPLGDVVRELSRWYDLDIRLGDSSLVSRTLTARFKDQSVDAVLGSLGTVLGLRVQHDTNTVTLLPLPTTQGR